MGIHGVIYKITNIINGKIYVGQTTKTAEKRASEHFNSAKAGVDTVFYKSIRKHGRDNFKCEVIDYANSQKELDDKEKYWIELYNTYIKNPNCNGYNMTIGGGALVGENHPNYGRKFSEEMRNKVNKVSKAVKGRVLSVEHKEKISTANKGKRKSQEQKDKQSVAMSGRKFPNRSGENHHMYGIEKESHPMYGKSHTDDAKKAIGLKNKGKLSGENNPKAKTVLKISENNEIIEVYKTQKEASEKNCISVDTIRRRCKDKKTYLGYKYIFKDDYTEMFGAEFCEMD